MFEHVCTTSLPQKDKLYKMVCILKINVRLSSQSLQNILLQKDYTIV